MEVSFDVIQNAVISIYDEQLRNINKRQSTLHTNLIQMKEVEIDAVKKQENKKKTRKFNKRWWWFDGDYIVETQVDGHSKIQECLALSQRNEEELESLKTKQEEIQQKQQDYLVSTRKISQLEKEEMKKRELLLINEDAKEERTEIEEIQLRLVKKLNNLNEQKEGLMKLLKDIKDDIYKQNVEVQKSETQLKLLQCEEEDLKIAEQEKTQSEQSYQSSCKELEKKLQETSQTFGQSHYTFLAYMKLLSSLHKHADNLTSAFDNITTAIGAMHQSLDTDYFKEGIKNIPEKKSRISNERIS